MRSMVLVGWMFALLFAVLLAAYVANTARGKPTPLEHLAALIIGWSLCLGAIAASARLAPLFAGCTAQ
jgi:tetrahydromethanopterin S-methyltransferase subunit E